MMSKSTNAKDIDSATNHLQTANEMITQACKCVVKGDQRKALLNSKSGVKLLKLELHNFFSRAEQLANERLGRHLGLKEVVIDPKTIALLGGKYTVQLIWDSRYKNTLENSTLYLRLWKGKFPKNHLLKSTLFKPKMISQREFLFDLDGTGSRLWREVGGQQLSLSSDELADVFINTYISVLSVVE